VRRVQFDPDALDPTADRAAGDEITFDSRIWKEMKTWLFEHVFDGKCAYCEAETDTVAWGDGEHWRPKGAVTGLDGQRVARGGELHPGYYWLAYDWSNLLPSCELCNRPPGKGTRFPIAGDYAFSPAEARTVDDLDARERPLLLHPFRGPDPADHIDFNELGQPIGLTPEGRASIDVFNLPRSALMRARRKRYSRMEGVAKLVWGDWMANRGLPHAVPLRDLMQAKVADSDDFSLARRVYLRRHIEKASREFAAELL
jgi:hypothetical protein